MDKFNQIKKEIKKFFKGHKGSHDWEHTERVYNLCLHIGKKEKADVEILRLAAILHDIARGKENKAKGRICHADEGVKMARSLLKKYNFSPNKIDKITHCIEAHRFRNSIDPLTKEAKILSDADKLDAIGATGLARAFVFAGEVGARVHNKDVDLSKTKPYTEEDTGWREFNIKLKKIKDRMLTVEGKRLAKERHDYMIEFFNRLNKEVEGEL